MDPKKKSTVRDDIMAVMKQISELGTGGAAKAKKELADRKKKLEEAEKEAGA